MPEETLLEQLNKVTDSVTAIIAMSEKEREEYISALTTEYCKLREVILPIIREENIILKNFEYASVEISFRIQKTGIIKKLQDFSNSFCINTGFTYDKVFDMIIAYNQRMDYKTFHDSGYTDTFFILKKKKK